MALLIAALHPTFFPEPQPSVHAQTFTLCQAHFVFLTLTFVPVPILDIPAPKLATDGGALGCSRRDSVLSPHRQRWAWREGGVEAGLNVSLPRGEGHTAVDGTGPSGPRSSQSLLSPNSGAGPTFPLPTSMTYPPSSPLLLSLQHARHGPPSNPGHRCAGVAPQPTHSQSWMLGVGVMGIPQGRRSCFPGSPVPPGCTVNAASHPIH